MLRNSCLFIFFLLTVNCANAQDQLQLGTAKDVYIEALSVSGPTIFSVHYDMRFKGQKGLGAQAGFGFWGSGGGGALLNFPFGLNYLLGKSTHYAELGLGATVLTVAGKYIESQSTLIFVPLAGYRFQPDNNGITVRAFLSPWGLDANGFGFILAGGLSIGYKF